MPELQTNHAKVTKNSIEAYLLNTGLLGGIDGDLKLRLTKNVSEECINIYKSTFISINYSHMKIKHGQKTI